MMYVYGQYNDGQTITEEDNVLKRCGVCEDTKPLSMFSKDRTRADGLRNVCKSCDNLNRKERGYVQETDNQTSEGG